MCTNQQLQEVLLFKRFYYMIKKWETNQNADQCNKNEVRMQVINKPLSCPTFFSPVKKKYMHN